jgi:hypothetical protein
MYFIFFLAIMIDMNPKIPENIIRHLQKTGYDIKPELGDTVITHGDNQHIIYIQMRDGKKTYIPITLTQLPEEIIETVEQKEIPKYSLQDLQEIGITESALFQTPTDDGDSTLRSVHIAEPGIVVLSNIDSTRYGIIDEMYVPDQYHILAEKVSSGTYVPIADNTSSTDSSVPSKTSDETPQSAPVTPIVPVVSVVTPAPVPTSVPMSEPVQVHHKSLAELLGQVDQVSQVSHDTIIPTTPVVNPVTIIEPIEKIEKQVFTSQDTQTNLQQEKLKIVSPISLEQLTKLENSLLSSRTHEITYKFLSNALQKKWVVEILEIPKKDETPVPTFAQVVSPDPVSIPVPIPAQTPTATTTGKLDPLSMFNN